MIGNHPLILEIQKIISRVADTPATVLIHGESGTGKELVACALHQQSYRKDKPFIAINCGAIPGNLLESEMFGHARGAFTGAHQDQIGWFKKADQGTIFLDEVCCLPLILQVKLLRVLQTGEFSPVGNREIRNSNVRIIAASNINIQQLITEGKFREDLYYRLNVIDIDMPPLRERGSDILLLANHFLKFYGALYHKKIIHLTPKARDCLQRYDFPGNVRELQNAIEHAVIFSDSNHIEPHHLPVCLHQKTYSSKENEKLSVFKIAKQRIVEKFEQEYLQDCLESSSGNITQAAKIAGINVKNFYTKMTRYEIDPHDFK